MWELLFLMLERLGIIVTLAFLLTRITIFRNMLRVGEVTISSKIALILVFGSFGIFGTYTGVPVRPESLGEIYPITTLNLDEAIANSRIVGVATAGLLGGPLIGLGAGVVAGIHRLFLGGFTAVACGVSTIVGGLLAGWIGKKYGKDGIVNLRNAFLTGILAESLQMSIILLMAKPFPNALVLVETIGMPMIVANSVGITLFIAIIKIVHREEERYGALQAQTALRIAGKTLCHLRQGLNKHSADAAARIILEETGVAAVAVTNQEMILAHLGEGDDHHKHGSKILTEATRYVLDSGEIKVARSLEDIHCSWSSCPLKAAIIMPLIASGKVVGTLKLYFTNAKQINPIRIELARGLARLFSNQLELSELERQARLGREAEIRSLQSQISPHFLFNSLNASVSLCRSNPEQARELLVQLGHYLRQNIRSSVSQLICLSKEIEHVKAYMAIESARFPDGVFMEVAAQEGVEDALIPPLILQPLVENALKHGFGSGSNIENGIIYVRINEEDQGIKIEVIDNGKGIDQQKRNNLLIHPVESAEGTGTGLYNVHQRLIGLFGEEAGLHIESSSSLGTNISFVIPKQTGTVVKHEDSGYDRGRRAIVT